MSKAPPDNLGSRQRALNARVNEAIDKHVHFDHVQDEDEVNDIDKLYKIDVAAKHKNVDYILNILKSGDSLYTSRALKKCPWLFEDEYSHVINPTFLQSNVFPCTSMKMKRKIIKTVVSHIRNPERAAEFFQFCLKEKMTRTAFMCLLYTTDDFKRDQMYNNAESIQLLKEKNIAYFRFFVGKSFTLLNALLEFITSNITETVLQFKSFFTESEENYLDIAEKYIIIPKHGVFCKFDPKLSNKIMKRHKHRVLAKPKFYVNTIDIDVLLRHSTTDDMKKYITALLPDTAEEFWRQPCNSSESCIFQMLPHKEAYAFYKKYFTEFYPNSEFEMHKSFYTKKYYQFMTLEQREEWALRQIESEKQLLGVGRDFLFYKFINFNTAFKEIKRYISITNDAYKRNEMAQVLIFSARNDRELETLFKYYSKRHMNELEDHKAQFLDIILDEKNVFEFDEDSWTAFYALTLAMDLCDTKDVNKNAYSKERNQKYKTAAVLYHILHEKEIPERLLIYLLEEFRVSSTELHLDKITDKAKRQIIRDYFFNFYVNIIDESKGNSFGRNDFCENVEPKWKRYFENIKISMELYNDHVVEPRQKPTLNKRRGRPKNYEDNYSFDYFLNEKSLIRDLKRDKKFVISKLSIENDVFKYYPMKINIFLKKIKVYFPDDVAKIYLEMFRSILSKEINDTSENVNAIKTAGYVVFQLADEEEKKNFINNYFPVDNEKESNLSKTKLYNYCIRTQSAIWSHACSSRPPLPLSSMLGCMKASSLKICMHLSNMYLAVLPLPMCIDLVRSLLDAPVSIQKYAIRLAFHCFSINNLKNMILNVWTNTKNVTLRKIIYEALYSKVVDTADGNLYAVLEIITQDLNQDDEDVIFHIAVSDKNKLPDEFIGHYISALWGSVRKFKDIEPNITRKKSIIKYVDNVHMHLVTEEFISKLINEHVNEMLVEKKLHLAYSKENIAHLYKEKWLLTAHYIVFAYCKESTKITELAQNIARKNIESWNEMSNGLYIHQNCFLDLLNNLKTIIFKEIYGNAENLITVFEAILKIVETDLKYYYSYLITWELQLVILTANIMKWYRQSCKEKDEIEVIIEIIKEYGDGVFRLVSERVENNKFYTAFAIEVTINVQNYIRILLNLIYGEIYNKNCESNKIFDMALITAAGALVKFEQAEGHMIAINLLPIDSEECSSDTFKYVINKLQECNNAELQLILYQKFQKYCDNKNY